MDGKGEVEDPENVVRLPRDWVGPPEELVPIGARARARARDSLDEPRAGTGSAAESDEDVPGAAAFWGEGASAVHHAIQGPAGVPDPGGVEAPVSAPGGGRFRAWRRGWSRPAISRRTAMGAASVLIVAAVITVVMALHSGAGPRSDAPRATASGSLVHFKRFGSAVQAGIAGIGVQVRGDTRRSQARLALHRQATVYRRTRAATELEISEVRQRRAAAARAKAARSTEPSVTTPENEPVSDTHVTPPAEASTAPTTTAPATTAPTATTPTATAPATTTNSPSTSTGSSSGTHRVFGVGGLLGAGKSSGG